MNECMSTTVGYYIQSQICDHDVENLEQTYIIPTIITTVARGLQHNEIWAQSCPAILLLFCCCCSYGALS